MTQIYKRLEDYTIGDHAEQASKLIFQWQRVENERWQDETYHGLIRELFGEGTVPSLLPQEAEGQSAVNIGYVTDNYHALLRTWAKSFSNIFSPKDYPPEAKVLMGFLREKPESLNSEDKATLGGLMGAAASALNAMETVTLTSRRFSEDGKPIKGSEVTLSIPNKTIGDQSLAYFLCALPRVAKQLIGSREEGFTRAATEMQERILYNMADAAAYIEGCRIATTPFPKEDLRKMILWNERAINAAAHVLEITDTGYLTYGKETAQMLKQMDKEQGRGSPYAGLLEMVHGELPEFTPKNSREVGAVILATAKHFEYLSEKTGSIGQQVQREVGSALRLHGYKLGTLIRNLKEIGSVLGDEGNWNWDHNDTAEPVRLINSNPKHINTLSAALAAAGAISQFDIEQSLKSNLEKIAALVPEINTTRAQNRER